MFSTLFNVFVLFSPLNLCIAYAMRVASVYFALQGRYFDAVTTMHSATAVSGSACPLGWRALAVMTYLYSPAGGQGNCREDVVAR
jgi:hypothetical protein